jgi:hypothetical protein
MFIGEVTDRTGDHEVTLNGDAHAEADGVHFDGDGDFVSIPNFKYYDGARWSFSMWISTDVCDPDDPTPSIFGYIYSHNQLSGAAGSNLLTADNQNINVYQSCAGSNTAQLVDSSGYVRFVFVGDAGFLSFDVTVDSIERNLDEHAAFTQFAVTFNSDDVEVYVNGVALAPYQLTPSPIGVIAPPSGAAGSAGNWNNAFNAGSRGHGNLVNINDGAGIGKFHLNTDIYLGGRADEDPDRFYTGAIAGLQIFTDGMTATDAHCIYQGQEQLILGSTAHSCTYHSEGYSWIDPLTAEGTTNIAVLCDGVAIPGASCEGSLDDGYIHIPLGDLHFPFMGRSENDLYISTNGYISFSGEQATDGGTTIIPLHGAKPDDAIFVYWTDLDFTTDASGAPSGADNPNTEFGIYSTVVEGESLTITWLNAPYFCGVQQGAPTIACKAPRATASFQVTLSGDGRIKMQYHTVDPFASPPWAPVSIGLEGYDGWDGIQVVYDDHNFPKQGTAIGFSESCGTAGENDCDTGDIARASASCLLFSAARPDCVAANTFGQPIPADCGPVFCASECFGDAFNLNEDCVCEHCQLPTPS